MSATSQFRAAEQARETFRVSFNQLVSNLVRDLETKAGIEPETIDRKALFDACGDGLADALYEPMRRLRDEAECEESMVAIREVMADIADYHSRVL